MVVHPKVASKLLGIFIMSFCAVLISTLFLNSNMDMARIEYQITDPEHIALFELTLNSGRLTSAMTGGALALTTVVMLFFYIKHYIDTHKSELGILKAIGYSNWKIARSFWVFGLSVLAGAGAGFGGAFALMSAFYRELGSGTALPDTPLYFNPILIIFLVILPAAAFALLAVLYAYLKLKRPALELIKGKSKVIARKPLGKRGKDVPFLQELKRSTVRSRFSLLFFIWLAAFTFGTCVVMSFSIADIGAGEMMAVVMAAIGMALSVTILFISVTTVIKGNSKTIAMLQVFGYSEKECAGAILSGYRPIAYVGFAIGSAYQHGLMLLMLHLLFGNAPEVPDYSFNIQAFIIALISFVLLYEIFMLIYSKKIKNIPLKEIMLEE